MSAGLALALLQGLRATALDPRLLKALLVAGAPLRLAIAANLWAGRSVKCASFKGCSHLLMNMGSCNTALQPC